LSRDLFAGNGAESSPIADKNMSNTGEMLSFGSKLRARAPAPEPRPEAWRLEPHVCRACFSRLVSCATETRVLDDGPLVPSMRLYQCTGCGVEALGSVPSVLCSCGLKLRKPTKAGRSGVALVDAGIRCVANPEIRAEFSQLFVAQEVGPRA
jgi:hypothetical protein